MKCGCIPMSRLYCIVACVGSFQEIPILLALNKPDCSLDKRIASLGGYPTLVVMVTSHTNVTFLAPTWSPAEMVDKIYLKGHCNVSIVNNCTLTIANNPKSITDSTMTTMGLRFPCQEWPPMYFCILNTTRHSVAVQREEGIPVWKR